MKDLKKPLGEWTLAEVKEYCDGRCRCDGNKVSSCPFFTENSGVDLRACLFLSESPYKWALDKSNSSQLTDAEKAICKSVGAKWVSWDEQDGTYYVSLWIKEPTKLPGGLFWEATPDVRVASVQKALFPSVGRGACICVETD